MEPDSILDRVMAFQQIEEAQHSQASEVLVVLLSHLSERERDVLTRRFGLSGSEEETLKEVGGHLAVTRERVRQIEFQALAKLAAMMHGGALNNAVSPFTHSVVRLFEQRGGILAHQQAWNEYAKLTGVERADTNEQIAFRFLIGSALNDQFDHLKESREHWEGWKLHFSSLEEWKQTIVEAQEICRQHQAPIARQQFFDELSQKLPSVPRMALEAHVALSKTVRKNFFSEYGLSSWSMVVPRRVKDKIYLILQRERKPLHFTAITELINKAQFDHKVAYPSTVHNELILDDHYVLVGRGIYALKEWGYEEGVVSDVISAVLRGHPQGMERSAIVEEVLKRRIVRKSTILLALTDRSRFERGADGKMRLKKAEGDGGVEGQSNRETEEQSN